MPSRRELQLFLGH